MTPGLGEVLLEQAGHGDVLREEEHGTVLGEHRADQLVEQVELLRAARELGVGLLQEVRRVVADLLEAGEQLEHQPAAGLLVGLLDPAHAVADVGLVEHDLLAGQAEPVVGLGLGRQLRRDARVGLAPAQQERPDQVGEPPGHGRVDARLDRRGPHLAEGVAAAEQPGDRPVEDRPQLGQVVLDGRAGQRHARRARDGPQRPRGGGLRVLHVLRLVGDHQVPPDLGQRCRVAAHRAVRRQHEPAARRRAGRTRLERARPVEPPHRHARRELADLGLPVAEEGGRADDERRARCRGAGAARSPAPSCRAPCRRPGRRRARGRSARPARSGPGAGSRAGWRPARRVRRRAPASRQPAAGRGP